MDIRQKIALYFKNNWGLKVNLRYWLHYQYCRLFSPIRSFSQEEKAAAQTAWKEGVAKIGTADVQNLATTVSAEFDKIILLHGCGALDRGTIKALAEPLYDVIKQIEHAICAYYKSSFRVNWIDVQKIVPGVQPKGSSFSYHIDDSPYTLAKVFIYLTDTYANNGAFRAFNYAWTDKFLRKGLLKSTQPGEVRDACQNIISKEDERSLQVIEGVKGTAFIFDNNLAHKGTLPLEGCRMHISMEIMPSTKPLTLADFKEACSRIPADNYSPEPFGKKSLATVES